MQSVSRITRLLDSLDEGNHPKRINGWRKMVIGNPVVFLYFFSRTQILT